MACKSAAQGALSVFTTGVVHSLMSIVTCKKNAECLVLPKPFWPWPPFSWGHVQGLGWSDTLAERCTATGETSLPSVDAAFLQMGRQDGGDARSLNKTLQPKVSTPPSGRPEKCFSRVLTVNMQANRTGREHTAPPHLVASWPSDHFSIYMDCLRR